MLEQETEQQPTGPQLRTITPRELRKELLTRVIRDLHGPVRGDDEELDGSFLHPRDYILGVLAPANTLLGDEDDDDFMTGDGDDEDAADSGKEGEGKPQLLPSSMGLTVILPETIREIAVIARWGRYLWATSETLTKDDGSPARSWQRQQMGGEPRRLVLREWSAEKDGDFLLQPEPEVAPDVVVTGRIRKRGGSWFVTLFLSNRQPNADNVDGLKRHSQWLYQAQLEVATIDGEPIFQARPDGMRLDGDGEERESAMLYRNVHRFATGHGCAVSADHDPDRPDRAFRIRTEAVPSYEVPHTDAPSENDFPLLGETELDMATLATVPDAGFTSRLSPLVRAYRQWIDERETEIDDLGKHRETAREAMERARKAADRIAAGIALLDRDPQAAKAFRFMNTTMHQQRVRSEMIRKRSSLEEVDIPKNRSWYPFQLAFILMNLPALTNLDDQDRSIEPDAAADLLWFPTGGGKTEAYLGLTAYTIAIRRLQGEVAGHDGRAGVAVIMRYTLRLLTLQQFQRATALMCACEIERRKDPATWGAEPIRIGLWVGARMTPNTVAAAEKVVRSAKSDSWSRTEGDVLQLTSCPWCGTEISQDHLHVDPFASGKGRTYITCGDPFGRCPFSQRGSGGEGLPVLLVDEEIYRHPPALLIATVDKFAQMPWKGAVQNLFGRATHRCERHGYVAAGIEDARSHQATRHLPAARTVPVAPLRPPDLIIQDELHLISGPLGTLVGLFETAVDALATWDVEGRQVRPKVVASTATIRRAPDQIRKLFARGVNVFPPSGLDITDNFFSRQREPSDEAPGRLYVGIAARGSRMKQVLIRLYAAILAAAQQLAEQYGEEAADPYMTLVGYFGSLRELGGMRRLVDDDIASRALKMDKRGLGSRRWPNVEELTSRRKSSQIPEVLDKLSVRWTPPQNRPEGRAAARPGHRRAIDVLLATNMISVGVDVPRLGLMVVNGQPKNTAEYIQATSRVGRNTQGPGLVFTVFQWTRPRDISHYENFVHGHTMLYRHVEPLSVTPFASRALDRGLSSVLVSMVRLVGSEFAENQKAQIVTGDAEEVQHARAALVRRGESATVGDFDPAEIDRMLDERMKVWAQKQAGEGAQLVYEARPQTTTGTEIPLLQRPEEHDWAPFTALSSLRDVESGIGLILREHEMGTENRPPVRLSEQGATTDIDESEGTFDE